MCPPADPIRPVGPVADGVFVARAEPRDRVEPRRDRTPDEGGSQRHHHASSEEEQRHPPEPDPAELGMYDDHGRAPTGDDSTIPHRHIDVDA